MTAVQPVPITEITPELIQEHGFTEEEYSRLLDILGREPNLTELGIFSVMWSEHCSYKSSRLHLKKLPTEAPWVICGPGENAGIIDIGDNQAAIFKIESHNHPSFIEPYQGAATGVGGIMRDVFTMGARPVANLNALRFGELSHPKTKHLLSGVVAGIGGYGNCVGVPTVGGECIFHKSYNGNILVNAMCVGLAEQDKIFYSAASHIGSSIVYVGSKTGRDGIHGATMASAEFDDASEEKRPTVQVGDPFTEKLLIEACLELMATDAILAIQDMGAAGLTCSSLEMADKGDSGIELNLEDVPVRETGMTPYEIMLSESQERMLMVIKPEKEALAKEVFEKWELDFAVIGKITDSKRMVLKLNGNTVADLPVKPLSEQAPLYDRPHTELEKRPFIDPSSLALDEKPNNILKKLLSSPDLASKRWIYEQYDYQVMNDTLVTPGANSALVRIHGTNKAIAVSTDCTPRYCEADPFEGGKQAVAENYRNICSTGAKPLAITNCLNFGNPEKPEIMAQFVGCVEGIAEACKALDTPVVSGNVSLYNETQGQAVQPTPTIGGVGLLEDLEFAVPSHFTTENEDIFIVGETTGHLGSSVFLREIKGQEAGAPPTVDLTTERKHGDWIQKIIHEKRISSCSDISDGGLYVALAEMAIRKNIGATITSEAKSNTPLLAYLFGEDQGRYIVSCPTDQSDALVESAKQDSIPLTKLGTTQGSQLIVDEQGIDLDVLSTAHEATIADYMKL